MAKETKGQTVRALKRIRLHSHKGTKEKGEIFQMENEDELDALLRGPDPMVEELTAEDLRAIERQQAKEAAAEEDRRREEEGLPPVKRAKGGKEAAAEEDDEDGKKKKE